MPRKSKKVSTVTRSTYDPWISIKKFGKQAALVGGLAAITFAIEEGLPTLALELPEYAVVITIASGVLIWVANYLKHHEDEETIEVDSKGEETLVTKTVGKEIVYNKD